MDQPFKSFQERFSWGNVDRQDQELENLYLPVCLKGNAKNISQVLQAVLKMIASDHFLNAPVLELLYLTQGNKERVFLLERLCFESSKMFIFMFCRIKVDNFLCLDR